MLLGVTGGIACGKTTVSKCLEKLGCVLIDADRINGELSQPGGTIWVKVKEEFGKCILLPDGAINKKALGERIFNNPAEKRKLEEISHPLIIQEENRRIREIGQKFPDKVIVLEAALMIEAGEHRRVDKLIVVSAPMKKRVEWLFKEKGMDRTEAVKRIEAQMPCEEKAKLADYVIRNDGTKEELARKAEDLFRGIKAKTEEYGVGSKH